MADKTGIPHTGLTIGERRVLLFVGDIICVAGAIALAVAIWMALDGMMAHPLAFLHSRDLTPFFWLAPLWFFFIANLYDPHVAFVRERTVMGLAIAAGLSSVPYLILYFVAPPSTLPRVAVLLFLVVLAFCELGWRLWAIHLFSLPAFQRPVIVVGAGKAGREILHVLMRDVPGHFRVAGLIDDDTDKHGKQVDDVLVWGGGAMLPRAVQESGVSTVVLAITGEICPETVQSLLACQENGVEVIRMTSLYEELLGRVPIRHLEADWLVTSFLDSARIYDLYGPLKRGIDIAGGLVCMGIAALLFPAVAVLVRLDSPGPIFYTQDRAGRGGKPFRILKYRTMVESAEADGKPRWAADEDPRITRIGKWLRRTRLDEWPQFWNVVRGDISLVGPRAERPEINAQVERQIPFYRARLLVRPGITGWSQVNFGYVRTVEDTAKKLEYDLYYIRHRSFWLDFKILLRTLGTILRLEGE
jgi:exopolysaccharide biosynthesis polyprenyl glycosylphosphotransferase